MQGHEKILSRAGPRPCPVLPAFHQRKRNSSTQVSGTPGLNCLPVQAPVSSVVHCCFAKKNETLTTALECPAKL